MSIWLDGVLVSLVLSSLWLLGSSRLRACIQAVALQGALLGLIPFLTKWPNVSLRIAGVALASTIIKAVVLPTLLRRAVRETSVRTEVEPLAGFTTSLLLGIGLWGLATSPPRGTPARKTPPTSPHLSIFRRPFSRAAYCFFSPP